MRALFRLLAFACGGLVGAIAIWLLLRTNILPQGLAINWRAFGLADPPSATSIARIELCVGACLGGMVWLGFAAGRISSGHAPRLGEAEGRLALVAGSLVAFMLLGALLGILLNVFDSNVSAYPGAYVLAAFVLGVPLAHGYIIGCLDQPNAVVSGVKGLLYGPFAGALCGLASAFVYVATYHRWPCVGCRIDFGPEFGGYILLLLVAGLGLALGIVIGCAEVIGLWLGSWLGSQLSSPAREKISASE